jgi:exonuclease VII small subunit
VLRFGVARVADLAELHSVISELDRKQENLGHSMERQVSYIKQLDSTVTFNHQAAANFSSGLKLLAPRTKDTFQEISSKLEWETRKREASVLIRQLEYALTKLEASLDLLIHALQTAVGGRIPVGLVPPPILLGIPKKYFLNSSQRIRVSSRNRV